MNDFSQLINFANQPTYNNMWEAGLTKRTINWIGEAQDQLTTDYWFTVTYQFNVMGLATSTTVKVQIRNSDGSWTTCGEYSPGSGILLSTVLDQCNCITEAECVPSDRESEPVHYYVPNYYVSGYYV